MERKKSSTADLLAWPSDETETETPSPAPSHQPSDGMSKVVFGGQVTDEEFQTLNKRKPVSEISGHHIFAPNQTQVSFGGQEFVYPQKAHSEAKQRELSGTLDNHSDSTFKKQFTNAKNKDLSGHDIFPPPPDIQTRPLAARTLALTITESAPSNTNAEEPVKTAKKILSQKFTELSGNNIFKGDEVPPSAEKHLSSAKLREMSGSNIFADGEAESRDYRGGVRKPPGGESSISLA